MEQKIFHSNFMRKTKIRENRRTAKENLRIFDRRISHGLTIYLSWIFLVSYILKIFQQMNWQRTMKWLCVLLGKHLPENRTEWQKNSKSLLENSSSKVGIRTHWEQWIDLFVVHKKYDMERKLERTSQEGQLLHT